MHVFAFVCVCVCVLNTHITHTHTHTNTLTCNILWLWLNVSVRTHTCIVSKSIVWGLLIYQSFSCCGHVWVCKCECRLTYSWTRCFCTDFRGLRLWCRRLGLAVACQESRKSKYSKRANDKKRPSHAPHRSSWGYAPWPFVCNSPHCKDQLPRYLALSNMFHTWINPDSEHESHRTGWPMHVFPRCFSYNELNDCMNDFQAKTFISTN